MKKSKPASIRFEEDRLNFVLEREGLKSKQEAVNFLFERYWWEGKLGVMPPTHERNTPQHPDTFPQHLNVMPSAFAPTVPKTTLVKSFSYYNTQIRDLQEENECREFLAEVAVAVNLTPLEKKTLTDTLKNKWK